MSQEKVNARKEYKKNRKQILAKEKRQKFAGRFVGYICVILIVCGIGFSVYKKATPEQEITSSQFYSLIQTDEYGILSPSLSEE